MCRFLTTAIVLSFAVAGCSQNVGAKRESVFPVTGSVTVDGKPAEAVRLTFTATSRSADSPYVCEVLTGDDGRFVGKTYTFDDGIPPGTYEVRIVWPEFPNPDNRDSEKDLLNGRYNKPTMPAFTFDVTDQPVELPPYALVTK